MKSKHGSDEFGLQIYQVSRNEWGTGSFLFATRWVPQTLFLRNTGILPDLLYRAILQMGQEVGFLRTLQIRQILGAGVYRAILQMGQEVGFLRTLQIRQILGAGGSMDHFLSNEQDL
eukprot:GHVP01062131.1.p2 GENE.GHVP01062131.1~~GHVP01062131.1.p2  ORF type:complete len:117 (-),score=10.99 GHVP01062131.1:182-532(-)